MFNLESSISTWRSQMLASGIKSPVPLDELESHLREDFEQQLKSGLSGPDAFDLACNRIGRAGALDVEFRKVQPAKPVYKQIMLWVLLCIALPGCWIAFGQSSQLAVVYSFFLAGLIIASLVDFQQFIIPDSLTLGGIGAGLLCSLLLPQLHGQKFLPAALWQSLLGIGVGAGLLYLILRFGKLLFGRQRFMLANDAKIIFTDTALLLPDKTIPYDELFYRASDAITLHTRTVQFAGHSSHDVPIRITRTELQIGDQTFDPREIQHWEAASGEIVLPREAMGMGDVKLMAAIGAFLGWQAVIFSLIASSLFGSCLGLGSIAARRRQWADRIPYGPLLALAAAIWIFCGKQMLGAFFNQ